jgi:spore maturation protein CgeB
MNRRNKKILIIGSNEHFTLEMMYYRALRNENNSVDLLSMEKILSLNFILKIKYIFPFPFFIAQRIKIIFFLLFNKKNYDLVIVFKGIYLNPFTISICKKLSIKSLWINIFPDDPYNFSNSSMSNKNVIRSMKFFDYYCLWSKKIISKINNKSILKKNKLIYLPFAFDDSKKITLKKTKIYKYDVNFIGSYDNLRHELIRSIKNKNFIIAGGYWLNKKTNLAAKIISHVHNKKLFNIVSNSKISLNILRPQNFTAHNMRTFEIPSMNGLMLTTRSNEQNIFFKENKACFMYNGEKELTQKINFILNNPRKAERVRKEGFKISKKHTYRKRARYLLRAIY